MSLPLVTLTGNLVTEAELRFTGTGKAVASFRVACESQKKDGDTWIKDKTCFLSVTVWGKPAEALCESALSKGSTVTVTGRLEQRDYETREGEKRSSYEVTADDIAVTFRSYPVSVLKGERGAAGGPTSDPWAQPATTGTDEPPF